MLRAFRSPRWSTAAAAALAAAFLVLAASPASAHLPPVIGPGDPFVDTSELTEIALIPENGPGISMTVLLPPPDSIDPLAGYPATDPVGVPQELVFAGVILAERRPVVPGSPDLRLFCIQARVDTSTGVGYVNRPWGEVENLGYVAQILANYFPSTGEPASLANDDLRAAAVQAAIWFIADGILVPTSNPTVRNAAAAIVADVLARGPIGEPQRPSITIVPPAATAPVGTPAGPFTIQAEGPATLTVTGGQMFADAAGTQPLPSPSTVPSGTQFWVRSDTLGTAEISARGPANIYRGTEYFYDGADPDIGDAQLLILAQNGVADAVTTATATFVTPTTVPAPGPDTPGPSTPAPAAPADTIPETGPGGPGDGAMPMATTGVLLVAAGAVLVRLGRHRRPRHLRQGA